MDKKKYIEELATELYGVKNCAVPFVKTLTDVLTDNYQYIYVFDMNINLYSSAGDAVPRIDIYYPDNSTVITYQFPLNAGTESAPQNQTIVFQNLVALNVQLTTSGVDAGCQLTGYKVQVA